MSTSPELDALVRAAVSARLAIEEGTLRDRANASAELCMALIPFTGLANLDMMVAAEDIRIRVPDSLACIAGEGAVHNRPTARRTTAPRTIDAGEDLVDDEPPSPRSRRHTNGAAQPASLDPVMVAVGKPLPACTTEDLAAIIVHCRATHPDDDELADRYVRLFDAVYSAGVETVGDLPVELGAAGRAA